MTLNVNWYDVEKYWLKWLRVLDLCERTWVQVLCLPILCYLIAIILIIYLCLVSDNIIIVF